MGPYIRTASILREVMLPAFGRRAVRPATCILPVRCFGQTHLKYVKKPKEKKWKMGEPKPGDSDFKPRRGRQRVAVANRREYLARRKAEFEAEQQKAEEIGLGWKTVSRVMLERLPIVVPDFEPWELDMWNLQLKIMSYGRELPPEMGLTDTSVQPVTIQQAMRASPIRPAPRRTKADRENDRTSLDRALAHRLFLIVRRSGGGGGGRGDDPVMAPWQFIGGDVRGAETIRAAAERVTAAALGKPPRTAFADAAVDGVQLFFVGNCPAGWTWEVFSPEERKREGFYGRRLFFNRCQLIEGTPALDTTLYPEHLWVTKEEFPEYFGEELGKYLAKLC